MTAQEFSYEFDVMLNNYAKAWGFGEDMSKGDIRVDEYEKSTFLTAAQEELVVSLYTGRNSSGNSFDETEELRRYLSPLVMDKELTPVSGLGVTTPKGVGNSKFFLLPSDCWFIVYEAAKLIGEDICGDGIVDVVPVTHDEYNRVRRNPFRGPNMRRVLRLDVSKNSEYIELISSYDIQKYHLRYLQRPLPIIVADLDGLSINDETNITECELPSSVHHRILEMAVEKALRSKVPGLPQNNNTRQ